MKVPAHAWPDVRCGDCGNNGAAGTAPSGQFTCANCGVTAAGLHRDGVPWTVWLSLIDNEDSSGRVPLDPAWNPLPISPPGAGKPRLASSQDIWPSATLSVC